MSGKSVTSPAQNVIDLTGVELGPRMQACSVMEQRFAWAMGTGIARDAREAAVMAGYQDAGGAAARVRGHTLIHREHVLDAIREISTGEFRALIGLTVAAAKKVILNDKHPEHVKAILSLLSRLGFGEQANLNVAVDARVSVVDRETEWLDSLEWCERMGMSEERLIETFGYSGLGTMRQKLRERRARQQPQVIEHQPVAAVESYEQSRRNDPSALRQESFCCIRLQWKRPTKCRFAFRLNWPSKSRKLP